MAEYKKPFNKNKALKNPRRERDPASVAASRASRISRYQIPSGTKIDYKNVSFLQKYVTDRGKIVSRRLTEISAKHQRELSVAIRRARFLGLLQAGVKKK